MPQVSSDMTEADVVGWLVEPGDRVSEGDLLYELETEKSTVEIEAPASGVLREILVPAGSTGIAVGTVLAILDEAESDARTEAETATRDPAPPAPAPAKEPSPTPAKPEPEPEQTSGSAETKPTETTDPAPKPGSADVPATALARRVAERAGVDLSRITGSGARGRVTRDDVKQQLAEAAEKSPHGERRTGQSDATSGAAAAGRRGGAVPSEGAPHATTGAACLTARCRIDAATSVLERLNADAPDDGAIGLIDLVVRATALALEEVPDANVAWDGDASLALERVDVAIALATDRGEVSGVIRDASTKGLAALSAERRALADEADPSRTDRSETTPIALGIADFGTFGLVAAAPSAPTSRGHMLGVGAAISEPVVVDGQPITGTSLTLTLCVNPHIGDAFVAARLLAAIARRLERPLEMIV